MQLTRSDWGLGRSPLLEGEWSGSQGRPLQMWAGANAEVPVGAAVVGTVPRICDRPVFPRRGLRAAARARHPAALPLGLRPGLLQDGTAVSGRVGVLAIHTTCSGCGETQGETWVGFITHVVIPGRGLWEAQLPSRPSAICKSKGGRTRPSRGPLWECPGPWEWPGKSLVPRPGPQSDPMAETQGLLPSSRRLLGDWVTGEPATDLGLLEHHWNFDPLSLEDRGCHLIEEVFRWLPAWNLEQLPPYPLYLLEFQARQGSTKEFST